MSEARSEPKANGVTTGGAPAVVNDLTGHDRVAFYLAYVHPAWMVLSLSLAAAALRVGLGLRRERRLGRRRGADAYRRHLRLAKPALVMISLGFVAGIASAVLLRGWDAFGTAHSALASAALVSFLVTGFIGRRLERGDRSAIEWHARLAALSVLLAAAALGTGFVLLP